MLVHNFQKRLLQKDILTAKQYKTNPKTAKSILNKTSIQWNPDVKFMSATMKKCWSKMIFEQQNQKHFPEIIFQKKIWEK